MRPRGIEHAQVRTGEAIAPAHTGTDAGTHAVAPQTARLLSEREGNDDGGGGALAMEQTAEGPSVTSTRQHVEAQRPAEGDGVPIEEDPRRPRWPGFSFDQRRKGRE